MSSISLCLEDFVDSEKRYAVDSDFIISQRPSAPPFRGEHQCKPQGYYSERTLGIFKRRRCVVCVYMDGPSLKMALMGQVYDLSDEGVTARVRTIFPCARRFTLFRRDEIVLSFDYWFFEWKDYWPECDIFPFIERITQSPESKKRFLLIWNELAAGGDVTKSEFLARLESAKGC